MAAPRIMRLPRPVRIPPIDVRVRLLDALRARGPAATVGGSGLLVGFGLADTALEHWLTAQVVVQP